jgi:UDP-glucose 4-epimerase
VKKACVIGGSGFLGSHVADVLTNRNYDVTIYDSQQSKWKKNNQLMCVGDLMDVEKLESAIENSDLVYNFAAIADLNDALDKPIETAKINILGNLNILEICRKLKIQRFMYASTIYVYSREGGFYRCSKQASEQYIEEYKSRYGLNYTILRYGSLYGPRSGDENVLHRIIKNALLSNKISYEGTLESVREYIHVLDAASSSVDVASEEFINQSVILSGNQPMRVLDLLKMISEILGLEGVVEFRNEEYTGHYVRTPYSYQPKLGRKYHPELHIDLSQGILDLISHINAEQTTGFKK